MADDLQKIKELLEIVKHKVDMLSVGQTGQSATVSLIKDQLSMMNSKLDEHTQTLSEHSERLEKLDSIEVSVIETEKIVKGYADAYKINKGNIERLDDRLTKVEDNFGLNVSPDLVIQR